MKILTVQHSGMALTLTVAFIFVMVTAALGFINLITHVALVTVLGNLEVLEF